MHARQVVWVVLVAAFLGACGDNVRGSSHDAGDDSGGDACADAVVDDGNPCTTDACDPATGVVSHQPVDVNDSNACTTDACDPSTGVTHVAVAVDDSNACTVDACDPATGVTHTPVSVDDADACTTDACDAATGTITHVPVAVDDSDACTVDACDPATGVSHTPVNVDDSNACTTDACDPTTGVSHVAVTVDDGNGCTIDACDPTTGVSHTPVSVDDNDACTTDACDAATGTVTHVPVAVDDGDACTADACDAVTGVTHVAISTDDGNGCTIDACDPTAGVSHTPVNANDGNACTMDACNPATGNVTHVPVSVDDGNACTADACDPTTGVSHTTISADDSNACTIDACDPTTGVTHTPIVVDDGNACTADACDVATGNVTHVPVATDDGNACTADACDPANGVSHTPVNVNDGNACTADTCDPVNGVSHAPISTNDGDGCTIDACDPTTGVTHTPLVVDDGNACTADACDAATGNVTHVAVAIDDGNGCTADACDPATGISHTPVNPDDGNACTVDACDPVAGVTHTPTSVDDGNECTVDACDPATGTITHVPVSSDDAVACTVDACDPATGLITHAPDDSVCGAGQVCMVDGCDAAGAGDQIGEVIISEFDALSSTELVEVRNTTAAPVNIGGYVLKNSAGQTATIQGSVTVPAGGHAYGVANPVDPAQIPAGAFVYGAPGTTFALADTGDVLALINNLGFLEDVVNFTSFHTNPSAAVPATAFVGYQGATTQLDPTKLTADLNDNPLSWCVTFYPAPPATRSRVTDTRGQPNGSCSVAVLNEALIDPTGTDDGFTFIEIAAPGGSLAVAGASIFDIEGLGASAGMNNAPAAVIPAGTRVPVDGILVVADELGTTGTTNVPNADVIVNDADFENSGGDSLQLVAAGGTLLDALGHNVGGAPLDLATNANGVLYETSTALYPPSPSSLARSNASTDTNNNRNDWIGDPTPTPGVANGTVALTVTSITPDDGLASAASSVVVKGADFATGVTAKFGSNTAVTCSVTNATTMTCNAPANGGVAAVVNVVVTNPASVGGQIVTISNGFTYTRALNETDVASEADYCNLQFPPTLTVQTGQSTPLVYGQLYEAGLTEAAGAPAGVIAELGYAVAGSNPTTVSNWRFFPASFNVQVGNNDEFMGSFVAPAVGSYYYTYRFSFDGGLSYTYCDLNGAGANAGLTFETAQLGLLTVTP